MDKKQAIKSIEHFTEASLSAVYDGNAPATKSDLQKLRADIAQLAKGYVHQCGKHCVNYIALCNF